MSETIELQTCEHCSKDANIETMTIMGDCWFCKPCLAEWERVFDACEHEWADNSEDGEKDCYCHKCSGFLSGFEMTSTLRHGD